MPLRFGVFLFTFLQFLFAGAGAGMIWYSLASPNVDVKAFWNEDEHKSLRIGAIVAASIWTFTALVGLLGFIGAALKKNGLVRTFYAVLWVAFLCQFGTGIWSIVTYFKWRNAEGPDCEDWNPDKTIEVNLENAECAIIESLKSTSPALVIVPICISLLVTAYMLYVTHAYSQRIIEQKREGSHAGAIAGHRSTPSYGPVSTKADEAFPLTGSTTQYAYTDNGAAFGHQRGTSTASLGTHTAYDPPVKGAGFPKTNV